MRKTMIYFALSITLLVSDIVFPQQLATIPPATSAAPAERSDVSCSSKLGLLRRVSCVATDTERPYQWTHLETCTAARR
jgi:hypothetical protein